LFGSILIQSAANDMPLKSFCLYFGSVLLGWERVEYNRSFGVCRCDLKAICWSTWTGGAFMKVFCWCATFCYKADSDCVVVASCA